MKRSLIAAALSIVATGSALAQQNNVTIYGRLNDSLERQKVGSSSATRLQDNASRIGFKGTEDLGGGMKANFVIEHGFNTDNGTAASSAFWNRESTVGLSSATLGAIRLGNMPASEAYFATADYVSMHNHDTGTSSDALYGGVAVGLLQNAIAYTSPTIAGFRADVQYSLAEGNPASTKPRSFALNYDLGALHLGAGYEANNADLKSLAVRGLYELGAFVVGGYVERDSGPANKRTNIRLSGMYTMGASEFHANVGVAGKRNGVADTGAKQITLAYNYNLSKRTKVFAFYTKIDNQSAASYGGSAAGTGFNAPGAAGDDRQAFALGVRHNF